MLLNFYVGNDDWDGHNWYAGRKREPGAGYQFFSWDAERSLEGPLSFETPRRYVRQAVSLHRLGRPFTPAPGHADVLVDATATDAHRGALLR